MYIETAFKVFNPFIYFFDDFICAKMENEPIPSVGGQYLELRIENEIRMKPEKYNTPNTEGRLTVVNCVMKNPFSLGSMSIPIGRTVSQSHLLCL